MWWILIASTGEQTYLTETLNHLNWRPKNSRLVASVCHLGTGIEFPNEEIIWRKEKLSQFDHYEQLCKELPIHDDDRVTLLDDDDILISDIMNEDGSFVGQQILVDSEHISGLTDYLKLSAIKDIKIDSSRLVDDLSGTTTSGLYFKAYFQQRPDLSDCIKMLEDTKYMNFVEKLHDFRVPKTPFVLHRLKPESSLWLTNLTHLV